MGVLQSIDNAREENVGPHGVKADALKAALTRAEGALEWLRARHADNGLPLLRLPETRGDLETIRDTARQLRDGASDIVILGRWIQSRWPDVAQLAATPCRASHGCGWAAIAFHRQSRSPQTFRAVLERLPLAKTRFVAISKSGGTAETLMQTSRFSRRSMTLGWTRDKRSFRRSEPAVAGRRNGLR